MTATKEKERAELRHQLADRSNMAEICYACPVMFSANRLISDSERLAAIEAVTGEEVKSMVGQCRFQARYETLDPDYIRFMESVADALLSLSAKVAEQAEEIALLKRQLVRFAKDASDEAERADTAESERDALRRLLTETAVPALADVASWVGGMCSCRADDEYHDGLLKALSTIRAHMEGWHKAATERSCKTCRHDTAKYNVHCDSSGCLDAGNDHHPGWDKANA